MTQRRKGFSCLLLHAALSPLVYVQTQSPESLFGAEKTTGIWWRWKPLLGCGKFRACMAQHDVFSVQVMAFCIPLSASEPTFRALIRKHGCSKPQ
uniref:Putative secreted protein n=1 Tax=Rhipicephalus microplus TaxID=6941 RepID=A0A6M2DA39_RHIMP